ncbi:MAG: DNA polymerase Y family protein [Hyphomonas sp.]|uniref:Y-family DNA polymerase n=1 Tax=Hyphomonas sp. TaxID=87 RepID=UPI003528ECA3
MRRYLSVWFPEWSLDRLRRARRGATTARLPSEKPADLKPFVLYEKSAHGLVVAVANLPAQANGIHPGLSLTDARATLPDLQAEELDRQGDHMALAGLAAWMVRFSPLVGFDGEDGLILETTGCDHLFDGEADMAASLSTRLTRTGYAHRIAFAGTPGAAHAFARTAAGDNAPVIQPPGTDAEGLADLPVRGLRLSDTTEALLRRFGLTRIGQLYGIDRKALARRFHSRQAAEAVGLRLDQALGLRPAPILPLRAPPEYTARLPCPEPLTDAPGISAGLSRLTDELCAQLARSGLGAQCFGFHAFRSDGEVCSLHVNAARPVRDPAHVLRLFRERIERIDPGFGIDLLLLEALRTGPMESGSRPLGDDIAPVAIDEIALAALADKINARLGEGIVTFTSPEARHPPDASEEQRAFAGKIPEGASAPDIQSGLRPVRMLSRPERIEVIAEVPDGPPLRFVWRRVVRRVVRADGPERIAPEWWTYLSPANGRASTLPRTRDYYRVEDEGGRRYWVFREGLYGDGRGSGPDWFVQGMFA